MNQMPRFRLAFIVLALCTVLSIVPLASAQSDPLPMPQTPGDFPTLGQMADRSTRNPSADLMATAAFTNGGDASTNVLQEGGAPVEVDITLNAQPDTPVTLTYGIISNVLVHPNQITFTPDNWYTPQTVEVHALENYQANDWDDFGLDGGGAGLEFFLGYAYEQTSPDGTYLYGNVNFGGGFNDPFFITVEDNPTPPTAPTGPLVVTTLADSYSTIIEGSLRQALLVVESRPLSGDYVITFQAGLTGTLSLAADLPYIRRKIALIGPSQDLLTIDGNGQFMGFWGAMISAQNLTLSNFVVAINAGDINLTDVTVRDSGPGARMLYGSGAVSAYDGSITALRSTFISNEGIFGGALTINEGGYDIAYSTFTDNHAHSIRLTNIAELGGLGGAMYALVFPLGNISTTIRHSTFTGNSGNVGAIFLEGNARFFPGHTISNNTFANNLGQSVGAIQGFRVNSIIVHNSTFSGNTTLDPAGAAAIGVSQGPAQVVFSTFSGHNTGAGSGGVLNGEIYMYASVIANNSAPNPVECVNGAEGNGYLIFSADPACEPLAGDITIPTGVDPVLRDNGGSTMTHALLPESNVIDSDTPFIAGNSEETTWCAVFSEDYPEEYPQITTDQRGISRPQFSYCDFGAFESDTIPLPPVNLLINPSFETPGATENEALGWTTLNLRPIDRRWCGTPEFPETAPDGSCTFRFRGPNLTAAQRRLIQTVEAGEAWGEIGDTLTLSADIRTREWGAASRLMLTVTYTDGTTETAIVRIPSGTNEYQTLTASLTLAKPAQSATVLVRVKTGGTKKSRLWVDNVMLISQ